MNEKEEPGSNGLLIMPVSVNGASMRNILNVLFSPVVREKYRLPRIQTIAFLHQEDAVKTVKIDNDRISVWEACHRLVKEVSTGAEVRFFPIVDYGKDIPKAILKTVKDVEKENLVLDLTSGKKDITGILYTAACISEIENMIYIDVGRDESTGEFYSLSKSDAGIASKVKLTKFETISEIENLASLNHMDFILYKKSVQEILPDRNHDYHVKFEHAIDAYFDRKYENCIREIGLLNESIVKRLAASFSECFKDVPFEDGTFKKANDLKTIRIFQQKFEACSDPKRRREKSELRETFKKMNPVFSRFPAVFEMVSAIVNYRNLVVHPKRFAAERDDAKLVIDLMLRVCRSLSELDWFDERGLENE